MNKFIEFCRLFGLHPFAALGMFAVDQMLFVQETVTLNITWPISIAIAAILVIPCVLLQKFGMKEHWGEAIGKGVIIGILTAIPTSLPSLGTLTMGALGTVALLANGKNSSEDDKTKQKPGNAVKDAD